MTDNTTKLLTIDQAAERLACSTRHIRRIISAGDLPVIACGFGRKADRVHPADLEAYVRKRRRNLGAISRSQDECKSTNVVPFGGTSSNSAEKRLDDLLAVKPRKRKRDA